MAIAAIVASTILVASFFAYTAIRSRTPSFWPATEADRAAAVTAYRSQHETEYPFTDAPELSRYAAHADKGALRTDLSDSDLAGAVNAKAAILVDAATGEILFEKDADDLIPPASMTKLVSMYVAFRAINAGEISLDDLVEPPPESWASNIPPGSSLMFLGPNQKVSVRELLIGMAVASGNDAAIALAYHVAGSVPDFVKRMNTEVARLGLTKTVFVEPSGLSEKNLTTAREFADFALVYVREYPEALKAFHSAEKIEYPMPWNLPEGSRQKPIVQYATNKLLSELPGCDGLKTGFIHESGYNLTLTVARDGSRFISVTMGGSGTSKAGGSEIRSEDGRNLMEWAFGHFRTQRVDEIRPQVITVWGGEPGGVELVPAGKQDFTVPANFGGKVETQITIAQFVTAPIHSGDRLGWVQYFVDGKKAHAVPLVANRDVAEAGFVRRTIDYAARFAARVAAKIKN
jgi:D-alanyl-D-alanine carboxypeptidase (penicillin-binding protein 5/6)